MRYLHYITRLEDNKELEGFYSNNSNSLWTKKLWVESTEGKLTYKIWDRETHEVTTVA
tara:strand:+ start:425 stop:598 length:174 start_codon:yes stop_codon:yes gene_type:complete